MTFEDQMRHTPEGTLIRSEGRQRESTPLRELAAGYTKQADKLIEELRGSPPGTVALEELRKHADQIIHSANANEELMLEEHLETLVTALKLYKIGVLTEMAEEPHERRAFLLALVQSYERSLH